MVTSTNQNRQFYVANASIAATATPSAKGDFKVKTSGSGPEKEMYFEVLGADTVLKSDRIPVSAISYAKAVKASDMQTSMKKVKVTASTEVLNGTVLYTEDYILRIAFRQFYGMSDEDQYFKDAAVHATKGMSAADFYAAFVTALNQAFSREVGATATSNPYLTFSSDSTGITIEEKAQPWTLGTQAQERVYFEVVPTTIYNVAIGDVEWGTATTQTSTTFVGNGKKIADLEYFLLGERGDQYRKIGWPNDIETVGLVDASKEYNVLELHYSFTDTGVNSYKSEKDITVAVPVGAEGEEYTVINTIIAAVNTATGLSIATLAD